MSIIVLCVIFILTVIKVAGIVGQHYGKLAAQSEKPSDLFTKKAAWIASKGLLLCGMMCLMLKITIEHVLKCSQVL